MHLHKYEKIWLSLGILTLLIFLGTVGVSAFVQGNHPPSNLETINPDTVDQTPPFDKPGLRQIGEKEYEAYMVTAAFAFYPNQISVPVGSTVHFKVATKDVVHGFSIAGTNINMMVEPGYISSYTATLDKPGEYLLLCNEYCGTGHHLMHARLEVK